MESYGIIWIIIIRYHWRYVNEALPILWTYYPLFTCTCVNENYSISKLTAISILLVLWLQKQITLWYLLTITMCHYLPLPATEGTDVCSVVFIEITAVFAHVKLAVRTQASSLEEYREPLKTPDARVLIEVLTLCQHPWFCHFFSQVGLLGSVNHKTTISR